MFSAVEKNNKKPLNISCYSGKSPARVGGTDTDSKSSLWPSADHCDHHCDHQLWLQLKRSVWTKKVCRISFYRSKRLWELPDWHQCGRFHSCFENQMSGNDRPKVYCSVVSNLCKNFSPFKANTDIWKHISPVPVGQRKKIRALVLHPWSALLTAEKLERKVGAQGTASMISQDTACQQGWD